MWGCEEEKGSDEENKVVECGGKVRSETVMYKTLLDTGTEEAKQMYN